MEILIFMYIKEKKHYAEHDRFYTQTDIICITYRNSSKPGSQVHSYEPMRLTQFSHP